MRSSGHFCHITLSTVQQTHYVVSDVRAFTHIILWLKIQSCHPHSSITNHLEIPTHPSRINLMDTSWSCPPLCCPCDWSRCSHYLFSSRSSQNNVSPLRMVFCHICLRIPSTQHGVMLIQGQQHDCYSINTGVLFQASQRDSSLPAQGGQYHLQFLLWATLKPPFL